jgi:hypothetical protein
LRAGQYSTAEDSSCKGRTIQHSRGQRSTSLGQDSTADVSNGQVRAGQYSTAEDSSCKGRTIQYSRKQDK